MRRFGFQCRGRLLVEFEFLLFVRNSSVLFRGSAVSTSPSRENHGWPAYRAPSRPGYYLERVRPCHVIFWKCRFSNISWNIQVDGGSCHKNYNFLPWREFHCRGVGAMYIVGFHLIAHAQSQSFGGCVGCACCVLAIQDSRCFRKLCSGVDSHIWELLTAIVFTTVWALFMP